MDRSVLLGCSAPCSSHWVQTAWLLGWLGQQPPGNIRKVPFPGLSQQKHIPRPSKLSPLIHQTPAALEHTYCHTTGSFEDKHTHAPCINMCICPRVESQSPTQTLNKLSPRHTVTLFKKPTLLSRYPFTSVIKCY